MGLIFDDVLSMGLWESISMLADVSLARESGLLRILGIVGQRSIYSFQRNNNLYICVIKYY